MNLLKTATLTASLFLLTFSSAHACTSIRLTSGDGGIVVGRTMEFGFDPQSDVVVVPAGTKLTSSLAEKSQGIKYKSKYGMVGANFAQMEMIVDGVNEKGLYVGALYLPGYASYTKNNKEIYKKALAPEDYAGWLLANFSTIEEIKAHYNDVVVVENPIKALGGASFPGHWTIVDASGASIVIEPTEHKLNLFENSLGVLTNSPTFDWHMTNLRNYVNLSTINTAPKKLNSEMFKGFGQGTGMLGLPGDFTPPSRFIRATAYSQSAVTLPTTNETVLQVFHIMNAFDIPFGAISESKEDFDTHDFTVWTSVIDLKNITWNFKTYKGQKMQSVNLADALKAAGKKVK